MAPIQANYAPNLDKFRKSLKSQPVQASVESLVSLLKRRQIKTPQQCAVATAHILLQVVAKGDWKTVDELLERVQRTGRRIGDARPAELVIGNITRRVLSLIRDEALEDRNADVPGTGTTTPSNAGPGSLAAAVDKLAPSAQDALPRLTRQPTFSSMPAAQSIFSLLSESATGDLSAGGSPFLRGSGTSTPMGGGGGGGGGISANLHALKSEVIDGIEEIMDEISQADDQIAAFADVQIQPGDYVMVHRPSPTVERFLTRAAQKRQFTVLVARTEEPGSSGSRLVGENNSNNNAKEMPHAALRKKLGAQGCRVVSLMNQGVMAFFPQTTKVLVDAKAFTASGGVVADAGAGMVARAAREHGRPVIVVGGVYKLSPLDLEGADEQPVLEWGDPSTSAGASYSDGELIDGIDVKVPVTEYLKPEMVDIYITNLGPHSRDHLQSVIRDHYKQEDVDFSI